MIKVRQRENEPVGIMLKRFKKLCEKEGLTKDIKRCSVYEKPSEKKRRNRRRPGPALTSTTTTAEKRPPKPEGHGPSRSRY